VTGMGLGTDSIDFFRNFGFGHGVDHLLVRLLVRLPFLDCSFRRFWSVLIFRICWNQTQIFQIQ
jgi:hypothetical protein